MSVDSPRKQTLTSEYMDASEAQPALCPSPQQSHSPQLPKPQICNHWSILHHRKHHFILPQQTQECLLRPLCREKQLALGQSQDRQKEITQLSNYAPSPLSDSSITTADLKQLICNPSSLHKSTSCNSLLKGRALSEGLRSPLEKKKSLCFSSLWKEENDMIYCLLFPQLIFILNRKGLLLQILANSNEKSRISDLTLIATKRYSKLLHLVLIFPKCDMLDYDLFQSLREKLKSKLTIISFKENHQIHQIELQGLRTLYSAYQNAEVYLYPSSAIMSNALKETISEQITKAFSILFHLQKAKNLMNPLRLQTPHQQIILRLTAFYYNLATVKPMLTKTEIQDKITESEGQNHHSSETIKQYPKQHHRITHNRNINCSQCPQKTKIKCSECKDIRNKPIPLCQGCFKKHLSNVDDRSNSMKEEEKSEEEEDEEQMCVTRKRVKRQRLEERQELVRPSLEEMTDKWKSKCSKIPQNLAILENFSELPLFPGPTLAKIKYILKCLPQ